MIIIATPVHLQALRQRLVKSGIDTKVAAEKGEYLTLDAKEALARFMVKEWPDEALFYELVTTLLQRARGEGRRVRAFGEMVALLWAQGNTGATVQLEHMWHRFCHEQSFSLFCAYPKSGFTQDACTSIKQICEVHSHVLS